VHVDHPRLHAAPESPRNWTRAGERQIVAEGRRRRTICACRTASHNKSPRKIARDILSAAAAAAADSSAMAQLCRASPTAAAEGRVDIASETSPDCIYTLLLRLGENAI